MNVGVLALQGAFDAHARVLRALDADAVEIRDSDALDKIDALILPGGESTTMSMLLETSGLHEPMAERLREGLPVFGTCAGLILLADGILDGRVDQRSFAAIDIDVRRNAFGRQVDSFEAELDVKGLDQPFHGVFIRAPIVERTGGSVEVLACVDDKPVLVRQGHVLAAAFHPELSDDDRIHRMFLEEV